MTWRKASGKGGSRSEHVVGLPTKWGGSAGVSLRPTKVLINVTIENSLGPVQVFMSPEDSVADLVKTSLFAYQTYKRRPLLKLTDPNRYALHYSPFCLHSLKPDDKLSELGSRNFFLCSTPSTASSCSANITTMPSAFPLITFLPLLL